MRDYKFQQPDLPLPRKRRVLGALLLKLFGLLLIAGVGYMTYQWLSTSSQKQAQSAEPAVSPDSRVIPLPIPPLQPPPAAPATGAQ